MTSPRTTASRLATMTTDIERLERIRMNLARAEQRLAAEANEAEVIDVRERYGTGSVYGFELGDDELDERFAAFDGAAHDDASRRWFEQS